MKHHAASSMAVFLVLGIALLWAPLSAHAQDKCLTGGVCCIHCDTECPGRTIACKANCISPCFEGTDCEAVGDAVANGVAASACARTKQFCNIPIFAATKARSESVSLEKCCNVIIGSCQAKAESTPCTVSDGYYGTCTKAQFENKYRELASQECKDTVCLDDFCSAVLADHPKCADTPPVPSPKKCSDIEYCWDQKGIKNCGWCYSPRHPNKGFGIPCTYKFGRCIPVSRCPSGRFFWNDNMLWRYGRMCTRRP